MVHQSAETSCDAFFRCYSSFFPKNAKVVEIGSCSRNGGLKGFAPSTWEYTGIDIEAGKNVDVVLEDPYKFPLKTNSVDVVYTSSCLEHVECPWLTVLESIRILKPKGLLYINAPSSGDVHGYPLDCWRHYPDAGQAYKTWCNLKGYNVILLESFLLDKSKGACYYEDFVTVLLKDSKMLEHFGDGRSKRIHLDDKIKDMVMHLRLSNNGEK